MRVNRILDLAKWGFNVPRFIHNANRHYGSDTHMCLKGLFQKTQVFCLLSTHKESGHSEFNPHTTLESAVLSLSGCDRSDTLIMEMVEAEFGGSVVFTNKEEGVLCIKKKRTAFRMLYDIKDIKLRHIVRTLDKIREKVGQKMVRVDFVWSTDFTGVFGSRLVVFDYKII